MATNISTGAPLWQWPLNLESYDRTPDLSCFELIVLKSWSGASSARNNLRKSLSRLYKPLEDVKNMSTESNWPSGLSRAQTLILLEVKRSQLCYWAWDQARWLDLFSRLSPELNTPLYLIAIAYLLGDFRLVHCVTCRYFYLSSLGRVVTR